MSDWVTVTELIQVAPTPALPAEKKSFFTLKRVIIGSLIWFAFVMAISLACLFYIHKDSKGGAERRVKMLGQGTGTLGVVGWAALWLPWAVQVGKRRREAKARQVS